MSRKFAGVKIIEVMEIIYLGHSSFRIKGKEITLVTDPFADPDLGYSFPKIEAQIVTVSHDHADHNASEKINGDPFVISGPGEYEVKGVSVLGFNSFHDAKQGQERGANTIYIIEMDGLRICHLGDLGEQLNEEKLEEINGVDILMVPVGGIYTLGPKEASDLVAKIDPSLVIPMHFKTKETKGDLMKLLGLPDFLKEMAVENLTPLPKLLVSKDKLPAERQVVILERKL